MAFDLLSYFLAGSDINPREMQKQKIEFAVLITGCDSGFGKALAFSLTKRGFVVFAGCLHKESLAQFKKEALVKPFLLDVTNDKSVENASKMVSEWLSSSTTSSSAKSSALKKERYFHALVNNAGIARLGLIDWAKTSDFKQAMDVNFLGQVRCVKAFLPIFKQQSAEQLYSDARIINMVSMAGLFSGGSGFSPYVCSKHAADAFTCNLQIEMKAFNVKVTAINPTFHGTQMANASTNEKLLHDVWNGCSKEQREEYGEGKIFALLLSFSIHDSNLLLVFIIWSRIVCCVLCILTHPNYDFQISFKIF